MNVNRITALTFFLISMLIIPLCLFSSLIFFTSNTELIFILKLLLCSLYSLLIFITGYWGLISYYLRYLLVTIYIIVCIFSIPHNIKLPFILENNIVDFISNNKFFLSLYLFLIAVTLFFTVKSISALFYRKPPVILSFPFKNGSYYILEGGDSKKSRLVNYHFAGNLHSQNGVNASMQYATDIVKLNSIGSFANGILPKQLEKYNIYEEPLYSPCDGIIIKVVNDKDNEVPFSGKHPYNVGNHIIIQNDGVNIVIGHIQKGSIKVNLGDVIKSGDHIGNVGNCGLTEFPHLHIQAMKSTNNNPWLNEGVPILFENKFLTKNTIIKAK